MWFRLSPHVSCTNSVGLEEVRAEVRQLDEKFNTIQSLLDVVMAKLSISVKKVATTPSRGEHPSNVEKGKSSSCRSMSPLTRSRSKEPISKVLEFGGVVEKLIVVGAQNPSGSKKASSGHEEHEHV